ncbi:MAG: hypothetical protein M3Q46_08250 [Verrucomicrobiota bacterium]|nr:hypothetical protein [Verrucomicrobiota bacterium]
MNSPSSLAAAIARLTSWAEAAGRLWATYWLLLIASVLIVLSAVLKWVHFPFSHNLPGLKFSLLGDPGINPHITPFSMAFLGIVLLGIGILFRKRFALVLCLVAAILVTLWALAPAQIAFRQPSVLARLTYELEVTPALNIFSKDYLVQNYGSPELVPKRLVLYSAWGRFSAAVSFLRLGWFCFGLGAALLAIYALGQFPGNRFSMALTLLCLPVGALLIVLIPPLIGQRFYTAGNLASAHGHNQEAIDNFRRAMYWDKWHAHDVDLYATIGRLQKQMGVTYNSPERYISRAVDLRAASEFEAAIFEFSKADQASPALAATARREVAVTRMSLGLALYRAGGIGSAVNNWELALAEDPSLIYVMPYLVRGYYDLGRYQAGIDTAQRLARLIRDHKYTLANVYSMAADCYAKLGMDAEARTYYRRSLMADPVLNYWALTGLAGE